MDNKYDVGLYGLWYGNNYGSIITYYALKKTVESMGLSVVMIKNPLGQNDINVDELRRSHPLRFAKEHYSITPLYHLSQMSELNKICKSFLLGSDQMWNYGLSKPYKQSYYFDFVDEDKKKIAYATSFGQEKHTGPTDEKEITKANLNRFDYISVRDNFSQKICQDEFGVKADIALDPVFLCPVEEYEKLIETVSLAHEEKYIFAYVLDPNPIIGESIKKIADSTGLTVLVAFNESCNQQEAIQSLSAIGEKVCALGNITTQEWLYYFKNAQYILTDSFHGACFSIIFKKQFFVLRNNRRGGARFPMLLEPLGLLNRMIIDAKDFYTAFNNLCNTDINYEIVEHYIVKEKTRSLEWLQNALFSDKKNSKAQLENKITVESVPLDRCTGCGACQNVCPVGAIVMKHNSEGFLNPMVDSSKCTNCGLCTAKCVALHPQYKNRSAPDCYALWASDEVRAMSSSGGAFSLAANYIIDNGGYVAGAVYNEDYSVKHEIISNKNDLWKMRGSKYMQSNVNEVYKKIKDLLENDILVLFSGLPCQVAALYSYLGSISYNNLYTIDLVCHGITSQKVFNKFHKDVLNEKKITNLQFKAKQPWGWHAGTNAEFEDGTSYSVPLEKCPYFIAYLKNIAKNKTCGECQFNKLPRQADLSIGDFWGISKFDEKLNDKKGTSVVLVNNEHGGALLENLRPQAKLLEPVPLNYALNGNRVMISPYKMHKNREYFFQNIDLVNFAELTKICFHNNFGRQDEAALANLEPNLHGLYFLAKSTMQNYKGRKIVTWGEGNQFKKILKDYFGLDVEFNVYLQKKYVNGTSSKNFDVLKDKNAEYYVVSLARAYDNEAANLLKTYGYTNDKDYIFRLHKPIVLENFDLSKGNYSDTYGNRITGSSGVLKKVIFRGLNGNIILGENVKIGTNIIFDMATNSSVTIEEDCRFINDIKFQLIGNDDIRATVIIGKNCRFLTALFKLYAHKENSSIHIKENCTFESNLELHANSGKKMVIGCDCMFSHDIDVWAGDGHSVFDVKTGKNTNSDFDNIANYKNEIIIGNHVWVSKKVFILAGTSVGTGSIIGAQSVVKGKYPNNCIIAGNPSKVVKHDVAWSRDMLATDINRCGSSEYVDFTEKSDIQY